LNIAGGRREIADWQNKGMVTSWPVWKSLANMEAGKEAFGRAARRVEMQPRIEPWWP